MPVTYRPPNVGTFLGDSGSGGSSVADLILASGRAQADAALRGGAAWGEGLGNVTQALAGGLQQYQQRKQDDQVSRAVRSAASPGADINSILSGLPPELQGRAQKGISDWNEFNSKRQESDLRIKKLQDEIAGAQKERQQHDFDTVAVGAFHAKDWLDQADGGLGALTLLSQQAKSAGIPGAEHYDEFISGAQDAWKAAQGDPKAMQTVADAVRQQATPLLQQMMSAGSATVQEKFKPEKPVSLGEGAVLVDPITGKKIAEGNPKETNLQHVDTDKGIQTFDPKTGQLGPVIGQPKPPAALITLNNTPGLSDVALDQAAEAFYSTGKMPPGLPRGAAGMARMTQIMNQTAKLHPDFNVAAAMAAFKANEKSLTDLQPQVDAVAAFENTAKDNSALLDGILKKLPDTGTSVLNLPLRKAAQMLGSEDMSAFNTLRQSVANEYSRIIASPSLKGVLSDSARHEGEVLLNPNATVGQIRTAIKTLAAEAGNRHKNYQGQLDEIMGRIRGKSAGGAQADPLGILK